VKYTRRDIDVWRKVWAWLRPDRPESPRELDDYDEWQVRLFKRALNRMSVEDFVRETGRKQ
jgi:hypothetical protein